MQHSETVYGFPKQTLQPLNFCESCIYGKQSCQKFPKLTLRASDLLELVHSDICGPMLGYSIRGARYFITFIDEYSQYTILYLLKQKSEAITKFKEYHIFVENQTHHRIQLFCTDNGTEFTSYVFQQSGVEIMVFYINLQLHIVHNKMVLQNGKTKLWWKPFNVCFKLPIYHLLFGVRLS